jgi:hypothetical protein
MSSKALRYEVALNEAVHRDARGRGGLGGGDGTDDDGVKAPAVPSVETIALCCEILDEMEVEGAFGAYATAMAQLKPLLYRALLSDDVTVGANGHLQRTPFAMRVGEQAREIEVRAHAARRAPAR